MPPKEKLPLLTFKQDPTKEQFSSSGRGPARNIFHRSRPEHGQFIKQKLTDVKNEEELLQKTRTDNGFDEKQGVYISVSGRLGYDLLIESLDNRRYGFELLSDNREKITEENKVPEKATVYIPHGKISKFIQMADNYLKEDTAHGKPKGNDLFESIEDIKLATIKDLWTDPEKLFPEKDTDVYWEVWLRGVSNAQSGTQIFNQFKAGAEKINLQTSNAFIPFPESIVLLAKGTVETLTKAVTLLDLICELRKPHDTTDLITHLSPSQQIDWQDELLGRISPPTGDAPSVCILDTGLNFSHPLLAIATDEEKCTSFNTAWGNSDHDSHGTEMAGICLYGDLFTLLQSDNAKHLSHHIESVKILPPTGSNPDELIGSILIGSTEKTYLSNPKRPRIFCLAVTMKDKASNGSPSSESAAIDYLCYGTESSSPKKLFCVSAGNSDLNCDYRKSQEYPAVNSLEQVHDPAQSWNALTIGAYTEKTSGQSIDAIAKSGELSPLSTTSVSWQNKKNLPIKPDIVLEGGNLAFGNEEILVNGQNAKLESTPDSLQILTTGKDFHDKPFVPTKGTSPAAALAANYSGVIRSIYPNFWEETIRGLLVHTADWTLEMVQQLLEKSLSKSTSTEKENFLRQVGFGVPKLHKCLDCARNSVTIITQNTIQPFRKNEEKGNITMGDIHTFNLPYPKEVLENLKDEKAKLTITLSYFIEPNPRTKSKSLKYSYASHGLKFATKKPIESDSDFRTRVNLMAREDGETYETSGDLDGWVLGKNLRARGSVHKDIWEGTCADLASKNLIAIHPTTGWWKLRTHLDKYSNQARYSLLVTLETDSVETDIYTPIKNALEIPQDIPIF